MSDVDAHPAERTVCSAGQQPCAEPELELLEPREVPLGGPRAMPVRRALPNRDRRMVGPWCFADTYGPTDIAGQAGMQVPPHPHTGLQTVSWLVDGEILHQDSLGSRSTVQPGDLPLMTAGSGIAHSEQSPPAHSPQLHGAQLWIALPESSRGIASDFEFHRDLPRQDDRNGALTVVLGEVDGAISPATTRAPVVGAALALPSGARRTLPLTADFEHAVLALSAGLTVEDVPVPAGSMLYLGRDRPQISVTAEQPAHALLLGGEPFDERLVMWWNFVGREHDEIVEARRAWERERDTDAPHRRFGSVTGYDGPALPAPAMPATRLSARSRYRHRG